jgi:hypothetical protein
VSTPSSQAAKQTLPAGKRSRQSHIRRRETSDHYVEPTWVSIRLFKVEDFDLSHVLLDPCTGFGRIAEAAKAAGIPSSPPTSLIAATRDAWFRISSTADPRRRPSSETRHSTRSKPLPVMRLSSARARSRCAPMFYIVATWGNQYWVAHDDI